MGLLDGLAGQVLGSMLGGGGQSAQGGQGAGQLIQVVLSMLQKQPGGLGGLLQQFQQAGLGDQAASWVGKGENMPCLLYTSDAADERSSVDLGGRRIIKKKKSGKIDGEGRIQ